MTDKSMVPRMPWGLPNAKSRKPRNQECSDVTERIAELQTEITKHPYLLGYVRGSDARAEGLSLGNCTNPYHGKCGSADYNRGVRDGLQGIELSPKWRVLRRYPNAICKSHYDHARRRKFWDVYLHPFASQRFSELASVLAWKAAAQWVEAQNA